MSTLLGISKANRVKTNCRVCSKEFDAVAYEKDGVLKPLGSTCPECQNKEKEKRDAEYAELERVRLVNYTKQRKDELRKQIPLKFRSATFKNYDAKLQPIAYKLMSNYFEESVILSSPNIWGVGKTHLVCALINKLIDDAKPDQHRRIPSPFYFTTESNLLLRIRNTFKNKDEDSEDEETIYKEIKRHLIVVIDDVGKVIPADLAFLQRVYFQIINDRYNDNLFVILTTNLDLKQLSQYIGVACADRLYEMCGKENIVVMKGESYRQREV